MTFRRAELAKAMLVAGVMSGTSADGVDVAICKVSPARDESSTPRVKLLGHAGLAYPKTVRAAVLQAMDAVRLQLPTHDCVLGMFDKVRLPCVYQQMRRIDLDIFALHSK